MLEILSAALAKLAALGVAAKATAGLTAAAAAVAAAGATGVLPALPEQADRGTVEQPVEGQLEELLPVQEPVEELVPVEGPVEELVPVEEPLPVDEEVVPVEDGDEARQPAPQASFGQSVAEDAREGGVTGSEIAEQARQQGADRRGDAGPPADLPEQSSTGTERAADAENNSGPGRKTADNAPVENAPAGTPGADRIPARR